MSFFGFGAPNLDKQLFNLKFTSKQLSRMHKKSEKQEKEELLKVKKAMEKGDVESARIYAQNAIRIKNTGNGYLRLSSRLDAVASRLESAMKMCVILSDSALRRGCGKFLPNHLLALSPQEASDPADGRGCQGHG